MKNYIKAITISAFSFLALSSIVSAQNENTANSSPIFWEVELPGGEYTVDTSSIVSVSKHSFVLKGFLITELNIDTTGSALLRIYHVSILGENSDANIAKNTLARTKEILNQASQRTSGKNQSDIVNKDYPNTTHQKTIEYRVTSEEDLDTIYKSAKRSWQRRREGKVTIE